MEKKFRITVDGNPYVVTVEDISEGGSMLYPEPGSMTVPSATAAPVAAAAPKAAPAPRGPAPVIAPPPPPDYGISSNGGGGPQGRAILLLVDQGNIRFGAARPVMQNALKFVDRLQPNDRLGLVAVPAPGIVCSSLTRPAESRK